MNATNMRDMCFGDVPLAAWKPGYKPATEMEPWVSFEKARTELRQGNAKAAVASLSAITGMPGQESRQYLQAWNALRELGVKVPDGVSKQLYGVVVEFQQEEGLDVLCAYTDHTARYLNYSGSSVIWETRTEEMDARIDAVLQSARQILPYIGHWDGERPGAPPVGHVRLNLLTPGGLCFGQGPYSVLAKDQMGGPLLNAAGQLLSALVDFAMKNKKKQ